MDKTCHLQHMETSLATHMLVFMLIGINNNLKVPLAYFAVHTASAGCLFPLLWEGVSRVEQQGLKASNVSDKCVFWHPIVLVILWLNFAFWCTSLSIVYTLTKIHYFEQVISDTSDKASCNQQLYRLHEDSQIVSEVCALI